MRYYPGEVFGSQHGLYGYRADEINQDGGPGSGNWGHAGRPGKLGGSGKGTGGKQHRLSTPSGGFTSRAQAEKENRQRSKASGSSQGSRGGSNSSQSNKKTKSAYKIEKVENKSFAQMNKEYPQIDVYLYGAYMRAKGETKYNINKIQEIGTQKKLIKEYGSLEKWREKAIEEYTKEDEAWLKTKLECFQEGSELNKEYEKKIVGPMDRAYNKTMSQYSDYDSDIKPNEFYEYQKASTKNMTVEDFAILENSYYQNHEAYGSNYTQYSTNRINGNELNWAQKKLEQIVSEHAVEIKEGSTFFRKTSEAEFKALTGKSLSEFNNNAPASERTATINKVTSFGTALQYNSFVACDVIIEYTAKKGSKAFFTTNTEELEGMLAPGTKISNITVQKESAKSIPSIYTKKGRTTYDVASFKKAEYVNPSKEQEGTYDFTYRGMGRENSIMAQRRELFNGITTPVNTCVRVLVEVE